MSSALIPHLVLGATSTISNFDCIADIPHCYCLVKAHPKVASIKNNNHLDQYFIRAIGKPAVYTTITDILNVHSIVIMGLDRLIAVIVVFPASFLQMVCLCRYQ
jgi:hypothetical protein